MSHCVRPEDVKLRGTGNDRTDSHDATLIDVRGSQDRSALFIGTRRLKLIHQIFPVGGSHKPHTHTQAEQAYYTVSGKARIRVGDESYEVGPGCFTYLPVGVEHEAVNIGDEDYVNLLIDVRFHDGETAPERSSMSHCVHPDDVTYRGTGGPKTDSHDAPILGRASASDSKAPFVGTNRLGILHQIYPPGGKHKRHSHARNEQAYFCVAGKGRVRVADEEHIVEPGCVVYLPTGVEHEAENIGEGEYVNLLIGVELDEDEV